MGWRIGDLALGLTIIAFILTGLTFVLLEFDNSIGQNTLLTSDLNEVSGTTSDVNTMASQLSTQIDNATSLTVDPNQQLETRTASSAGVLNLFSKNILINLITKISEKVHMPFAVTSMILTFIAIIVAILVARFFMGSGRV